MFFLFGIVFLTISAKTSAFDKALFIKNTAQLNVCPCINLASNQELELFKASADFLFLRHISTDSNVPDCHCSLNIVLNVKNVSHINFDNPRHIWLLFAEHNINTTSLFSGIDVPINSAVFLIRSGITKSVFVEELHRVAKSLPLRVRRIEVDGGIFGIVRSKTRLDMGGMNFTVGADNVIPTSYRIPSENGPQKVQGLFIDIFKALVSMLNYQFHIKWLDGPSGALHHDGSWSGLSAVLANDEIDVLLIVFNMTPERLGIADFPTTIVRSRYQVFIKSVYSSLSLTSIFKPLAPDVWITIGFWIIVVSTSNFACTFVRKRFQLNAERESLLAYWEFCYFTLQTLCQQAYANLPSALSLRIITIVAYLMGSIIIPSYSASLVSSLTTRTPEMPFTTVEEMVKVGYKLAVSKYSADFNHITTYQGSIHKEILTKSIIPMTVPRNDSNATARIAYLSMYKYLCSQERNVAILADEDAMDFAIRYPRIGKLCQTTKMNLFTSSSHQSFALKRHSPYTDAFRLRLLHMRQTGLLQRFSLRVKPQMNMKRERFIQVNQRDVIPIFYVLVVGTVLSVFLLLTELYTKRRREIYLKT